MKKCSKCGVEKDTSAFNVRRGPQYKSVVFYSQCKACVAEHARKRYKRDPDYGMRQAENSIRNRGCEVGGRAKLLVKIREEFAAGKRSCSSCNETKPLADFFSSRRDGPSRRCKVCETKANTAWQRNNPEAVKKIRRRAKMKQKYGITYAEYQSILDQQHGVCAICSAAPSGYRQVLDVDHCHQTGKVRGLLCSPCNLTLGRFEDNPQRFLSAAAYLEQHTCVC